MTARIRHEITLLSSTPIPGPRRVLVRRRTRAVPRVLVALSLATGLATGLACAAGPRASSAAPEDDASAGRDLPTASTGGEGPTSVRPGVNDRYYEEGAAERWSEVFERDGREVSDEREAIVAALGLRPGMRVADVGAGTGLFVAALADAVGDTGRTYAVDIAPAFLERLRERFAGDARVVVHEGTPTDAGLDASSVDLVFMSNVYHHIEYPSVYLPTLRRALVSGGELVVVDFRRIVGVTSPSMLKHVRADQATVRAEIEAAGFVHVEDRDWMRENYFMRFRAP